MDHGHYENRWSMTLAPYHTDDEVIGLLYPKRRSKCDVGYPQTLDGQNFADSFVDSQLIYYSLRHSDKGRHSGYQSISRLYGLASVTLLACLEISHQCYLLYNVQNSLLILDTQKAHCRSLLKCVLRE